MSEYNDDCFNPYKFDLNIPAGMYCDECKHLSVIGTYPKCNILVCTDLKTDNELNIYKRSGCLEYSNAEKILS